MDKMQPPDTDLLLTPCNADNGDPAGLFTKAMYFRKAGDFIPGHLHPYDHPTLLAYGLFEVDVEGVKEIVDARQKGRMLLIRKDKRHRITALMAGSVAYCIHIVRDAAGGIVGPGHLTMHEVMTQVVTPNDPENTR